jgi:hypothetical protein
MNCILEEKETYGTLSQIFLFLDIKDLIGVISFVCKDFHNCIFEIMLKNHMFSAPRYVINLCNEFGVFELHLKMFLVRLNPTLTTLGLRLEKLHTQL